MENHDLILKTLLEIKQDIGGLAQKTGSIHENLVGLSKEVKTQALEIQSLNDFRVRIKTKVGIFGTLAGSFASLALWLIKQMWLGPSNQ